VASHNCIGSRDRQNVSSDEKNRCILLIMSFADVDSAAWESFELYLQATHMEKFQVMPKP
jgi:hypothetical protein